MRSRNTIGAGWALLTCAAAIGGCGDDPAGVPEPSDDAPPTMGEPSGNAPPTIGAIPDQTVLRNTLEPRTLELDVDVEDPDGDELTVTLTSSDEGVVAGSETACAPGPCSVSLAPAADATAKVTITLAASDGKGGEAEATFELRVQPRLVTTTADDGAGSLRATIGAAEDGDIIGFDVGGAFASATTIELLNHITIDRDLTIEGPGASQLIVSGGGTARVLRITGEARVTLRALTVADGFAPLEVLPDALVGVVEAREGGGVLTLPASTLVLEDVVVTRSSADAGGGIANLGGTLVLTGSTVVTNVANAGGGGVFTRNAGGSGAVTSITGSVIEGNTAETTGGGVSNQAGTLTLEGTRVEANEVSIGDGGGVHSSGPLWLQADTRLVRNRAEGDGGGALTTGRATVVASVIEENEAGNGAGVYAFGPLEVLDGSMVTGNRATSLGGGLTADSELTVRTATVRDNSAERGGGLHVNGDAPVLIAGSTIADNQAVHFGGGLGLSRTGGTVTVDASTVEGNNSDTDGGGIWLLMASGAPPGTVLEILNGSRIERNVGVRGGGLRLYGRGSSHVVRMESSRVRGNRAGSWGGGVSVRDLFLDVGPSGNIDANRAGLDGGGVYAIAGAVVRLFDSVVSGNGANRDGGGLYGVYSEIRIENGDDCFIIGNVADVDDSGGGVGGGVYVDNSLLTGESVQTVCLNSPDNVFTLN